MEPASLGPPVATHHVHRITSRRSSSISARYVAWRLLQGSEGKSRYLDSRHDHISPAGCGLWSPRLMSVKQCQDVSRLLELNSIKDSKTQHVQNNFIYFARNMIHHFPTCSFFVHLVPRSVFQFQAFCRPTWQELHGPEHEETRGSRRNLERFQAGRESLQYRYHNF